VIWAFLLLACSSSFCDTRPEDLVIEDPDGLASEEGFAAAQAGLDDFREWTARDAICVSEMRFEEEIGVPQGYPEGFDVAGIYTSSTGVVRMEDHGASTQVTARHELCHGLDWTENLSEPNAEIFDPELFGGVSAYPEELRVPEAFARACAQGPSFGVEEALAEACSFPLDVDPATEFLHREVYVGYDDSAAVVPGGLDVEWVAVPEPSPEAYVSDIVATWGGLAGSNIEPDGVTHDKLWILATDGSVVAEADPATAVEFLYPVPWNQGAAYIAVSAEASPRVLGTDGSVREAPGLADSAIAVWDDVVFARTEEGLVGRDLWTGERVELGIDAAWWSEFGDIAWAQPAGDAVLVFSAYGDGWVGTPASGWTWTDVPDHEGRSIGEVAIGQRKVIPAGEELDDVWFLIGVSSDGTVYTTADACSGVIGQLVSVDGAPWLVDARGARFGRVVLTP
jgi:hypothetical protein